MVTADQRLRATMAGSALAGLVVPIDTAGAS